MVLHELAFQFTPLREGRHRKKMRKRALHDFNSRPSARGDGLQCGIILSGQTFQFTPLREGRPSRTGANPGAEAISIHAPPRGATRACWLAADGADISIHAPPRGATEQNRRESGRRSYFNSRPSARGDAFSRRGATYSQFQFTPLREGRPLSRRFLLSEENFNSRPSARGDEREPADDGAGNYFNSRPSARGDGLVG